METTTPEPRLVARMEVITTELLPVTKTEVVTPEHPPVAKVDASTPELATKMKHSLPQTSRTTLSLSQLQLSQNHNLFVELMYEIVCHACPCPLVCLTSCLACAPLCAAGALKCREVYGQRDL